MKRYRLWSEARVGMRLEGVMFPCKGMRGYPVQEMMPFDWVAQQLRPCCRGTTCFLAGWQLRTEIIT